MGVVYIFTFGLFTIGFWIDLCLIPGYVSPFAHPRAHRVAL